MGFLLIIIGILSTMLGLSILYCIRLNNEVKVLNNKFLEYTTSYHNVIYTNCVLTDKLEKIKNMNLIDYNNNDYYKELLSTEIE